MYHIEINHSSQYQAPENKLVEAFDKTLCMVLEKMVDKNKKTWSDKLPTALGAYTTIVKTTTQAASY